MAKGSNFVAFVGRLPRTYNPVDLLRFRGENLKTSRGTKYDELARAAMIPTIENENNARVQQSP
jgi:hypothetical protein